MKATGLCACTCINHTAGSKHSCGSENSSNANASKFAEKIRVLLDDQDELHTFASIVRSFKMKEMLESDAIVQLANMIRQKFDEVILGLNDHLSNGYEIVKVSKTLNASCTNKKMFRSVGEDINRCQIFYRTPECEDLIPLLASDVRMKHIVEQLEEAKMLLKMRNNQNLSKGQADKSRTSHKVKERIPCRESHQYQNESSTRAQRERERLRSKEQLYKIRDIVTTLMKSDNANVECQICLGPMEDTHISPDCLHRFCGNCFKESLRKCGTECPMCRTYLSTKRSLRQDRDYDILVS